MRKAQLYPPLTSFLYRKLLGQDSAKLASRFSTRYEPTESDKSSPSESGINTSSTRGYSKFDHEDDEDKNEDKYEGRKRKNVVRSYKGLITFATFGVGALIISQSYMEKKKFLSVVKSSSIPPVVLASSTFAPPSSREHGPQEFFKNRKVHITNKTENAAKKGQSQSQIEFEKEDQFTGKPLDFIADVVEKVSSSVVCINVKDHSIVSWANNHITPRTVQNGSGFIISEDGLILTNAHVVDIRSRSSIMVELEDGRTFAGIIEEIDPKTDLALVRINVKGLSTMPMEDSNKKLRPGSWVIAIGNPMSLSNSVSVGVISCVRRESKVLGVASDIGYIQTDATITMGNSGGPLVNLDGKAIGVNSMKITPGISFAIPIDYVKKFVENYQEARKKGQVIQMKRYMGVTLITLTDVIIDELEKKNNFKTPKDHDGVFIFKVVVGSPADLAGLQPGDIITHLNDEKVKSARQVHDAIEVYHNLKIKLWRNDEYIETQVIPENVHINSAQKFPKNDLPQNVACNLAQKTDGNDIADDDIEDIDNISVDD